MSMPHLSPRALAAAAILCTGAAALAQGPPPPPPVPPLGAPPVPPANPLTPAKAVLGKILFWEEQLSSDNSTACGTCHIPSAQGGDPRASAIETRHPGPDGVNNTPDDKFGSRGVVFADEHDDYAASGAFGFDVQRTTRSAPTMIGAAFFGQMFWDGRAQGPFFDPQTGAQVLQNGGALENQAAGPPVSDVEMSHAERDWDAIVAKIATAKPLDLASNLPADVATALLNDPTYPDLFQAAFGTPQVTAARIAMAIASYERTLVPDQTDWDAFNAGNINALTLQERNGLQVFVGPGRCTVCHVPPLFSNGTFRNIGVRPPAEDLGRQDVTGNPADRGRFKVPTLRNVSLRERFFHNGQETTLAGVLAFYARNGDFDDNKDPVIDAIAMPPPAQANVVAFLSGGLVDPRVLNELPPFDRPTLFSETPQALPPTIAPGVAGAGGVPQMIATAPPALGAAGFKIGLAGARGGTRAFLVLTDGATGQPFSQTRAGFVVLHGALSRMPIFTLPGGGASDGFATYHLELPTIQAIAGTRVRAQWWVMDPTAPGGFAKSSQVELTLF